MKVTQNLMLDDDNDWGFADNRTLPKPFSSKFIKVDQHVSAKTSNE